MIRTCNVYSVSRSGVLNVPFVAFNDDQAKDIVKNAFADGHAAALPLDDMDIVKIGVLDMMDGIIDNEMKIICGLAEIDFGGVVDDVSETV